MEGGRGGNGVQRNRITRGTHDITFTWKFSTRNRKRSKFWVNSFGFLESSIQQQFCRTFLTERSLSYAKVSSNFRQQQSLYKNPVIVFLPKGTGLYTVTKMIGGFCKNKLAAASVKSIKSVSSNFGLWSCSEVRKFMLGLQFLILLLLKPFSRLMLQFFNREDFN